MQLLAVVLVVSQLGPICHAVSTRELFGTWETLVLQNNPQAKVPPEKVIPEEDLDFEDDEEEDIPEVDDLISLKTDSLTTLRRQNGEILVPCFGMWWPVGGSSAGGPVYYDYGGGETEYYEDYGRRKNRKRAKKRRAKKAKMKKNKKKA